MTGEPFSFSAWGNGEPSGADYPDQDYMYFWRRDYGSGPLWSWWDETLNSAPLAGYGAYLIEFDGPFMSPVPEPTAMSLAIVAAVCIAFGRRRVLDSPQRLAGTSEI